MGRRFAFLLIVSVLGLALAAPVSASPQVSQWHRLNPATEDQANEHERLTCFEQGASVRCLYDKLPEEGFHFDETIGMFRGHDVTDRWTCPDWFDPAVCEGVTAVYAGTATYFPEDGRPFTIRQEYVLTEVEGQPVLYQHWVGAFACPWYETFAEATAANPAAEGDCFVAP